MARNLVSRLAETADILAVVKSPSYVKYNKATVNILVRDAFAMFSENMYTDLGYSVDIEESYLSEIEVIEQLRSKYKYKKDIVQLLGKVDSSTAYQRGTGEETESYTILKTFLQNAAPDQFEPPIQPDVVSNRGGSELLYDIPNYPDTDPRRTGRIIVVGPRVYINPTTIKYLIRNIGRYGFVHYGPTDPRVWYWRGDKTPNIYSPDETVNLLSSALDKLK